MSLVTFFLVLLQLFTYSHAAAVSHGHDHAKIHALVERFSSLVRRVDFPGFPIIEKGSLGGLGLSDTCEQVLYQPLRCHNYTSTLGGEFYHGSLEDEALTKLVCDASCSNSFQTFHKRVLTACASTPDLFPGFPVVSLVDSLWGGWNETCLVDTATGKYCNDIIASWAPTDTLLQMPKANLCSYCFTKKLAVMQQNPYGIYISGGYKEQYDQVVKTCNLPGTITLPGEGIKINTTDPSACPPNRAYTTKSGDTCDSIAKANKVSSASLYEINPNLIDCAKPVEGGKLCLPPSCEKLYEVKTSDNCSTIAAENQVYWRDIIQWNGMIDQWCSNINNAKPSFGKTICLSPPGGEFNTPPANDTGGGVGGPGGSGDGYAKDIVQPPAGAKLADNTTTNCGQYYTARSGDTCRGILVDANTPSDLFLAVNPSLGDAETCNSKLVSGLTYCIHPVKGWDEPLLPSPISRSGALPTGTATGSSSLVRSSGTVTAGPGTTRAATTIATSARPASTSTRR